MNRSLTLATALVLFCGSATTALHTEQMPLPENSPVQPEQKFAATVDGAAFSPDEYYAERGGGVVSITAEAEDESTLLLQLPDDIAKGSYALSYETAHHIMTYYGDGTDGGEAMKGTLRIDCHDTENGRIEGSFHFEGEMSEGTPFKVTDGKFALTYEFY